VNRDGSWCNYVLVPPTPEILITEDASKDARLAHNPYVAGPPFIKFYAGAPLVGRNGERFGTLCVVDLAQRAFTADCYSLLINFAALAVEEIERNRPILDIAEGAAMNDVQRNRHLDLSLTGAKEGIIMIDVREGDWPILYANPAFETASGLELDDLAGAEFWELFENPGKTQQEIGSMMGSGSAFTMRLLCQPSQKWLTLRLMPATSDRFSPSKATGIPPWVPSESSPKGSKLGLDVDKDKVVNVEDRNAETVQDVKTFWFVMVMSKTASSEGDGSSTQECDSSEFFSESETSMGPSSSGGSSRFGEYGCPAGLGIDVKLGPLLGSGSFGKVYRGTDEKNCPVAVKVIDCRGRDTGVGVNQLSEVTLSEGLDHPGVVKTLKHGVTTERHHGEAIQVAWIVQEFCDLGTLTDAAERGWLRVTRHIDSPPNMNIILGTLRDLADGMAYVHSKNVIHADLTGRNVLLASSTSKAHGWDAKVCDFGLARLTPDGNGIKPEDFGTVTHMAPSLLKDQVLYPAADVWAFGVIAWEAFYGKRCYGGKNGPQIIMTVIANRALEWNGDCPPRFKELMQQVLSFDYKQRPQFSSIVKDIDELSKLGLVCSVEPSSMEVKVKYVGAAIP
jgi:PAS domain-containing protein